MKTTYGWIDYDGTVDPNGNNLSGFSGLPGGTRYHVWFNLAGYSGYWWSSTPIGSNAYMYKVHNQSDEAFRVVKNRTEGFSVRCIEDSE